MDSDVGVSDFRTFCKRFLDGKPEEWKSVPQEELDECEREFKSGGVEACRRFLEGKQEEWKNVPLDVAVIGNSGVGKSSFINAIRRLTAEDVGAARVSITETTTDIVAYPQPNNPMLKFWDLPGVGTPRFPKDRYLKEIQVQRYDFFLLLSATRFTENDIWLGNEITKINRKYFFVRTKLGIDISNNRKSYPSTHNEETVISKIRENLKTHLKESGCEKVKVFLVDSYKQQKFDFQQLEQKLIADFPELKRSAMNLSMSAFSKKMVEMKVQELRSGIWKTAMLSGAVAATPLPGVSFKFDARLLVKTGEFYFEQLGLDDNSLRYHAKITSTNYDDLKAIVNRSLGAKFLTIQGLKTIAQFATAVITQAVEEFAHTIPIIVSIIAAPMSFGVTYYMLKYLLKYLLNYMEKVAVKVVTYAAEHAGNQDDDDAADEDD